MLLKAAEGKTIQFYKTKMVFKASLDQTQQQYTTILMIHPPLVGPAMHIHPDGPETFFVLEGKYTFILNGKTMEAEQGDFIYIPQNDPHKYTAGPEGGIMLVTTPPNVEKYFLHIAEKLQEGPVSLDYEFEYAKQKGQTFLDMSEHWGHK